MHRLDQLRPSDYHIPESALDRLLSPALVIFLDHVRHNLRVMSDLVGGDIDRWRPHIKTAKVPLVYQEMVRAGLRNFKCATTREASCMLRVLDVEGIKAADLLVAYPLRDPALAWAGELAGRHPATRMSVLCESVEDVASVPEKLGIFVDINPRMNRTGVPMGDTDSILAIARAAGKRFRGLHFYDGHVRDVGLEARRQKTEPLYEGLLEVFATVKGAGIDVPELVTSGTPSFPIALGFAGFRDLPEGTRHRISPGTVIYHDTFSAECLPHLDFKPAALVLSRVVSHPERGMVTADAGSKSIAAEAGHPCCVVVGHPELAAQRPSEEHLPFRVEEGTLPERGAPLLLVPKHVCPTVNLAAEALVLETGTEPRAVPVSARAHELFAGGPKTE
jgi:D-serine deaminase-like pyridoxal phosphate-dependent protein